MTVTSVSQQLGESDWQTHSAGDGAKGPRTDDWAMVGRSEEMIEQGIVESISPRHVGRLLEEAQIKPHQSRYWLTSPLDDEFEAKAQNISNLYITAIERGLIGERTACIDEMTGIQAIERQEKD